MNIFVVHEKFSRPMQEHEVEPDGDTLSYVFTLVNVGAAHYFPTGTPDRHLTLELRLLAEDGSVLKEKTFTMKRYILWRPFILDLKDTRLAFSKPKSFSFRLTPGGSVPPFALDATVLYHLPYERQRKKIGYENKEPIAYPTYHENIALPPGVDSVSMHRRKK